MPGEAKSSISVSRWLLLGRILAGPLLAVSLMSPAPLRAADSGPRAHAEGSYDAATGTYTVAPGDVLGAIAQRFGLSLSALERQNDLRSEQIRIGRQLTVGPASGSTAAPAAAPRTGPATARTASAPAASKLPADPWPRRVQVGDQTLTLYQPQVESWTDNMLSLRAAVAVKPAAQDQAAFGVVRLRARTQVDRAQRAVVLEDLEITSADFPTLPDDRAALASAARARLADAVRIVPLDRLEASLAAAGVTPPSGVAVRSAPPRIIVSETPAVLVPIPGPAVWKSVPGTQLQRVINTRAVILATDPAGPCYLHLLDGWMTAKSLDGPWSKAEIMPAGLDNAASRLAAAGEADLLNGSPSTPTLELLSAGPPVVYVSESPAELIVFKGQPDLAPIDGTGLRWASNTTADVIVDSEDGSWYVLLAGRWFRAPALTGPWRHMASTDLPADFARIPATSPAGVVLASVAGTPQAREAVIANSIPQTATVPLQGGPTFTLKTDGPATVGLLKGTGMEYVINSRTPVVRVKGETYYALQAGVWFQSDTLDGPWTVASMVPAEIYSIPPRSPLHYVTYVRIYGGTPDVVYEGYTPGYLGTVTADDGVVVYGTGYDPQPRIGDTWIAAPETYGLAAAPVYNPAAGYAYGFGLGLATAAAANAYWGGAHYRPYDAGYGCCATTSASVYGHWGDTVASGTRAWYAGPGVAWTGARGSYVNERTGTSGVVAAAGGDDAWTGTAQRGYVRGFDTTAGTTGAVERGERYDPATGSVAYGSRGTATGPGGSTVSRDTAAAEDRDGQSAAVHRTTLDSARTGETHTVTTARAGNNLYAGADGQVYRNTGDGWQIHDDDGWHPAGHDIGWADREAQARTVGEARVNALSEGGWRGRLGDGGGLGGDYSGAGFGGGGFGGRFGVGRGRR